MLTAKHSIGYTTNKLRALSAEGIRNYSATVVDLIVFTLKIVNDSFDTWKKTVYDEEIEDAVAAFTDAITGGTAKDLNCAIQRMIFSIFSQKRTGMADKYSSLVYSFCVLYSFCKEGHLSRCNAFTQYFSRVIWFGRVSIYNTIVAEATESGLGFFEYVPLPSSEALPVVDVISTTASMKSTSCSSG